MLTGWRFWTIGNRHAGKERRPVWPYSKLTFRDFKGEPWKKTLKNMSKWSKLFEWITQQLTDSDTTSHKWQVDGPTYFRTFIRIRKLLPSVQGAYKLDPGRRSVLTTCGILVKKLKEERGSAAAAAAATGYGQGVNIVFFNSNFVISAQGQVQVLYHVNRTSHA